MNAGRTLLSSLDHEHPGGCGGVVDIRNEDGGGLVDAHHAHPTLAEVHEDLGVRRAHQRGRHREAPRVPIHRAGEANLRLEGVGGGGGTRRDDDLRVRGVPRHLHLVARVELLAGGRGGIERHVVGGLAKRDREGQKQETEEGHRDSRARGKNTDTHRSGQDSSIFKKKKQNPAPYYLWA